MDPLRRVLLLTLLLTPGTGWAARAPGASPDLEAADATSLQQRVARQEYHASPNRFGLQAPNRAQGLRTYFEPTGIRVVDRMSPDDDVLVSLSLVHWGRPDAPVEAHPGEVTTRGSRVEIARANLVEWFENSPEGLEHGFTVHARPMGTGRLLVEVAVASAETLLVNGDLAFRASDGRLLPYGKLRAFDSLGNALAARFSISERGFRITVLDAGAVYPVTIDPLLLGPANTSVDDGQLESDQVGAGFGWSAAIAGDVNGDGYDDVIVGAPLFDAGTMDEGAAFVFLGSIAGIVGTNPATAHAQLESNQFDSVFGWSVAGAGDVNGDGYADVIVGARSYSAGQIVEGAAFVFLGSASGIVGSDPATAHAQLESNQAGSAFGTGVAAAGDVNGDGYGDIIVGAESYNAGQVFEGAAFIFLGSASGIADGNPSTAHAQLESDQANALFGASVAAAGDVNGDGYGDVIVGSRAYSAGEATEGAAFVFHGSSTGVGDQDAGSADAQLESDQAGAQFGTSVAGGVDVNGDGYSDVIAGGPFYDGGNGIAAIFAGSATGVTGNDPGNAFAVPAVSVVLFGSNLGRSVSAAGDVNGDGYGDFVVGAPLFNGGTQTEIGGAVLALGSPTSIPFYSDHFAAISQAFDALFGQSVGGGGDVNGDGFSDVIVGARDAENGETDEGLAFVYHGSAHRMRDGVVNSPIGGVHPEAFQLESNQAGANLGHSVASAGDVNGDGYDDVIVGAPFYDAGQGEEGAAFVFLSSAAGIVGSHPGDAHAVIESDQSSARLGASVAAAGDVNGDGYGDVIVGAPLYDNGENDEGAAFVFLGSVSGIVGTNPATAHAQLESDQVEANFGEAVASAGDVNGDGFSDVIVGALDYSAGESNEGAAFLFLGSLGGIVGNDPGTAHGQLESDQGSALLGISVASAGDVNGDGYADVIVGASRYSAGESIEGAAFVFLGSASGITAGDPGTANAQLESDQGSALLGHSVASAGDVNGDGYADVIVGAPLYDAGEAQEGAAFVFHGSASGIADGDPGTADAQLESDQAGALLGESNSIAGAGDVNGDGYADVLVGAQRHMPFPPPFAGSAWLFLGSASGIPDGNPSTADAAFHGDDDSFLGSSVASAGDVNGDGLADLIVGAREYDQGEINEGSAFVFLSNTNFVGVNEGHPFRPRQERPGGSIPVAPWGSSNDDDGVRVSMDVLSPRGRERAKLEVEACPAGVDFDDVSCTTQVTSSWVDLGTTGTTLSETVPALTTGTLYAWRARALYAPLTVTEPGITAPANPSHGPWLRNTAQSVAADVRVLPEPGAAALLAGLGAVIWLARRRIRRGC